MGPAILNELNNKIRERLSRAQYCRQLAERVGGEQRAADFPDKGKRRFSLARTCEPAQRLSLQEHSIQEDNPTLGAFRARLAQGWSSSELTRVRGHRREKEIEMTHMIGKAAAACAVAGLLVLGGVMPSQGQRAYYRGYVGPYGAFAYVPGYRRYWIPQYDTSGARVDPDALGWHGWPPTGAPSNPCTLGQAQQNRC